MKTNDSLQQKVVIQLQKDPLLKDAEIVVGTYKRGIVVEGNVNRFFKKAHVCKIVKENTRIKNISDNIKVVLTNPGQFDDEDIHKLILEKFEKNFGSSYKNIDVAVKDGAVVLKGVLKWHYQILLATECISYIDGIVSIQNNISTSILPEPMVISEKDILAAIYKEESITSDISVDLNAGKVTIVGHVGSPFQKKLVEKIVRELPGIKAIESRLQIVKNKRT